MDTRKLRPALNIPPGDFVAEAMELRGWTQENLAEVLGVSLTTVNKLIKAKQTITVDMAKRLSGAFGQSPQYWLTLEANYQLRASDNGEAAETARKSKLFSVVPVQSLRKKGWVQADADTSEVEAWLERLWETEDIESALSQTVELPMAARKSASYTQFSIHHAAIWFQVAKRYSQSLHVPDYNRAALEALALEIPQLSSEPDGVDVFMKRLGECGVKTFLLTHLPQTYTDGAAFWDGENPTIVVTGRIGWDDSFWFTMAHEIGHVLLHLQNQDAYFIDEDGEAPGECESEANAFAKKMLCHDDITMFFRRLNGKVSLQLVKLYAEGKGTSTSLVVGCLHHYGILAASNLNGERTKLAALLPDNYVADTKIAEIVAA